jgi:hypothetical protein
MRWAGYVARVSKEIIVLKFSLKLYVENVVYFIVGQIKRWHSNANEGNRLCDSGWDSVRLGWGTVICSFGHGNEVLASYKASTS